jgi:hypothetical protein
LASPQVCPGPVEELLSRFRRYLEQERGLVPAAARGYVDKVRPFVARFDGPDGLELWRVDVAEVRGFVVDVCPRPGRRSAQLTVVALRSMLRFLRLDGVIQRAVGQQTRPLPAARHAPRIPGWTMTRPHSPRASSAGSWSLASAPERLLRSFRSSSVTPARSSCRDCASRLKQTSGIGGRNGDIPAAAFLSPRVFARLCIRADPWRGPRRAPVANGMMIVGTKASELAVAAGAAMLVAGGRRPG